MGLAEVGKAEIPKDSAQLQPICFHWFAKALRTFLSFV
jgi:hypothetical protein